ncbi:MAG: hypothetical protein VXZ96_09385 [Myxococcota bacterium]|nr:hypothetical protein [Myxococcota bacterium]
MRWHWGEGQLARDAYQNATSNEPEALIQFLKNLVIQP